MPGLCLRAYDRRRQCIQRIMLAATGPKTVTEAHKVRLVDRVKHFYHCTLQHFVFQRRNRHRSLASSRPRS